ncbi:hypothetical protein FRC10_005287 [Ceratobasidium sp. 414]|nr:hypothetical protein FRC10_005287 [Ceratobasidium sp. 414]
MQEQGIVALGNENTQKPIALQNLARSLNRRYELSGDPAELDGSIACLSEAITLASDETKPALFSDMGKAYYDRSKRTGNLEDLGQAIECYHLVISRTPSDNQGRSCVDFSLGRCYLDRFQKLGELPDLDIVISFLSQAAHRISNNHLFKAQCMTLLGSAYGSRFARLSQVGDIDMAITCRSQVVQNDTEGSPNNAMRLGDLADSFFSRYVRLGQIGDSQSAIENQLSAIALTPDGDPEKAVLLGQLGSMYTFRFQQLGNSDDFDQAASCLAQVTSITSDGDPKKLRALMTLGPLYHRRFARQHKLEDLENAMDCFVQALRLTPDGHPDKITECHRLGELSSTRFVLLGELSDLEKALKFQTLALNFVPDRHPMKLSILDSLGGILELRYKNLRKREDGDHAIAYYRQAAQSPVGSPFTRLSAARSWGRLASSFSAPLSLQGYETMVDLLPQVFWMGNAEMDCYGPEFNIEDITTEVVAVAISSGSFDLALEWFDTCRVRAWKETLLLRGTSLTDLYSRDPLLAGELEQIAREVNHVGVKGDEREAHTRRRLVERWATLISHIRSLSGFEQFLQPKKAELVQATHSGAIVIVNAHKSRCDALVIRSSQDAIAHVPLPTLSFQKAMSVRSHLGKLSGNVESREGRMDTSATFEEMLGMLWDDIVQPVLDHLGYIRTVPSDELPRITWCLTGPLSGLPLHAAGRYNDPQARIFNYSISSYAPSLSSLLIKPSCPRKLNGVLTVGDAATSNREGSLGIADELARVKRQANALRVTELTGDNATPHNVLAEMEEHRIVHLACPVSQHTANPTTSTLHLPNSELALGTILSRPRRDIGIIYLSRAGVTTHAENMLGEAFPLATGLIMAGYCTVITTMWLTQDQDAAVVAEKVYARLNENEVMTDAWAAKALHTAVAHLRAKTGEREFMRWTPYVHIGL